MSSKNSGKRSSRRKRVKRTRTRHPIKEYFVKGQLRLNPLKAWNTPSPGFSSRTKRYYGNHKSMSGVVSHLKGSQMSSFRIARKSRSSHFFRSDSLREGALKTNSSQFKNVSPHSYSPRSARGYKKGKGWSFKSLTSRFGGNSKKTPGPGSYNTLRKEVPKKDSPRGSAFGSSMARESSHHTRGNGCDQIYNTNISSMVNQRKAFSPKGSSSFASASSRHSYMSGFVKENLTKKVGFISKKDMWNRKSYSTSATKSFGTLEKRFRKEKKNYRSEYYGKQWGYPVEGEYKIFKTSVL